VPIFVIEIMIGFFRTTSATPARGPAAGGHSAPSSAGDPVPKCGRRASGKRATVGSGRHRAGRQLRLSRRYDFLVAVDGYHQFDPCAWLTRYKDRIVSVLTKVYHRSASFVRFAVCYVLNTDEFEISNQKRAS